MNSYNVRSVSRWDGGSEQTGYFSWQPIDETILVITPAFTPGDGFSLCLPPKTTAAYRVVYSDIERTVLIVTTYRQYSEDSKSDYVLPGPSEEQLANFLAKRLNDPSEIGPL